MTEFYKKLKEKSSAISLRWKEALNQQWMYYYGFEVTPLSSEIWKQEKSLHELNEKFEFEKVGLIRIPPYFNYNWHQDTNRGCSINMLLSHEKSYTFFSDPASDTFQLPEGVNSHFIELDYEPNTFYAFNSQRLHCVFNFEKPRYLFSCEFAQQKNELSYERLCEWMDKVEL